MGGASASSGWGLRLQGFSSKAADLNFIQTLHQSTSVATLASILKRCGVAKALSHGRLVHAHIKRCHHSHNLFLGNWLVKMYGDCGSMDDARSVFDTLPSLNLHSWNILIKAYAQNGYGRQALESLHRMRLSGINPNQITLVSALGACKTKGDHQKGKQIHADLISGGYEGENVVGNALIIMYAKCVRLDDARDVFLRMPHRDVISWNAIISACHRTGHGEEALGFFDRMRAEGFRADQVTFVCALDACASLKILEKGQEIHGEILEGEYVEHVMVATSLVNLYGKCGRLKDARRVFDRMPERNTVSWSAMMSACTQNGRPAEALNLFGEMQHKGMELDRVAFVCALDACASLSDLEQGYQIHAGVIREGYGEHVVVGNALVNMYGKCKSLEDARSVFERMPYRDLISWNSLIAVCTQNGQSELALDLYSQMQCEGFDPESVTFVCALEACASLGAIEKGEKIHAAIAHKGYEGEVIVGTALIKMYGKCARLEDARTVFKRMACHDVVSWSAMIGACAQNGHAEDAINLFDQIQHKEFKPDHFAYACALDACADLAGLEKGREIHKAIIKSGCEGQVVVGTALVNMYGKCGSLEDARDVFDRMPQWNLVSWNAMIAAYAHSGHADQAIHLFKNMQCFGFKPNHTTFLSILAACSHSGRIDDARRLFTSMSEDHGLTQNVEHFLCLLDILGRAGQLNEAEDLINSMPHEKNAKVWLTLLGHCQVHGDMERGVTAARHALNLDPRSDSAHVLLSNIFAEAERLNGSEKGMWKDSTMQKLPSQTLFML